MKKSLTVVTVLLVAATAATAAPIKSYTPVLTGPALADFEGHAEGTMISNQYAGVTFSQAPLGGRPMIDVYPWTFGYGSSSGNHVLTGSLEGGYPYPTVAGIVTTFDAATSGVQMFLTDTSPLGDYTITAFGAGGATLESFVVAAGELLPPGYSGGVFPPPSTSPLPGIYVGFERASADIVSFQVGLSTAYPGDSFAVDDLTVAGGGEIPEPGTFVLLASGIAAVWVARRKVM